jgi:hypothetical protein
MNQSPFSQTSRRAGEKQTLVTEQCWSIPGTATAGEVKTSATVPESSAISSKNAWKGAVPEQQRSFFSPVNEPSQKQTNRPKSGGERSLKPLKRKAVEFGTNQGPSSPSEPIKPFPHREMGSITESVLRGNESSVWAVLAQVQTVPGATHKTKPEVSNNEVNAHICRYSSSGQVKA